MTDEYTPEQVRAHVEKKAKEIIDYARETDKVGDVFGKLVNENVEQILFFIYNMNREPSGESMTELAARLKDRREITIHNRVHQLTREEMEEQLDPISPEEAERVWTSGVFP